MYQNEMVWINPYKLPFGGIDALCQLVVSDSDITDALNRLDRFAPFIAKMFPETKNMNGIIESELREIPNMKKSLKDAFSQTIEGNLYLKMDSHLAVAGSVKARGGIYEILKHAETLCLEKGLVSVEDNYEVFAREDIRNFLNQCTVQVGSTGNLGMSIGIISASLGFKVKIHMSMDAKQWKKDLLRSRGVEVIEYSEDYSKAVEEGRKTSESDPSSYFVDDEKSIDLFIGYATAAKRLEKQLVEKGIFVSKERPLFVYIPAGVGGAPGGICYGLKRLFGDHVHCFFAETTTCPSVLIGIDTQKFEKADVRDYGISGKTEADGLACAKPSGFVTRMMTNLVSGEFTLHDDRLFSFMRMLNAAENIQIEPSACAGFMGPATFSESREMRKYLEENKITETELKNATHVVWATGGCMVPADVYNAYLNGTTK